MILDAFDTYFPLPEPEPWTGGPLPQASVETRDEEEAREQKWRSFEQDILQFADSEPDGFAAVLRAVAGAMKNQRELFR